MRLIDADAFIEYVNRRYDLCSDELRMMIEEQPTAYNVDNVVAEIEEDKFKHPFDEDEELINSYIDRAIKAVRKGGVE